MELFNQILVDRFDSDFMAVELHHVDYEKWINII